MCIVIPSEPPTAPSSAPAGPPKMPPNIAPPTSARAIAMPSFFLFRPIGDPRFALVTKCSSLNKGVYNKRRVVVFLTRRFQEKMFSMI